MKKNFLLSLIAVIGVSSHTYAAHATTDIASSASSANCNDNTLGTTSGTSNLEAKWTANTLNIEWYNGDEKITTTTCSYDGGIVIPNEEPEKTGYTFNGWKTRRAAATPVVPPAPNCIEITDENTCNGTNGCIYNDGDKDLLPWAREHQHGCGRLAYVDSVSYNTCSEITDRETCLGIVGKNENIDSWSTLCYWENGECGIGFFDNMSYMSFDIPQSWCQEAIQKWDGDCYYDSEDSICYCSD